MAIFSGSGSGIVGALDIGTAKVCCAIASVADGSATLLGIGHQRSRGLKSGMIVDADEAERAVRAAVGQAERMAGVSLERVILSVNCGRVRTACFNARAPLEGPVVRDRDIDRILSAGEAYLDRSGRSVIQLMRSDWRLDGAGPIAEPRGLAGRELAIGLTAVTADDGPLRNLVGVIERSHLAVERMVAAAYASALAVTTDDERRTGTVVVDLGAGITSIAAFADGRLVHIDSVPVGGNHVTYDIARELVTSVQEAERIKTLYGTLIKAASNDGEVFAYPVAGEDEGAMHQTSKAFVRDIAKPRIDGLIDLVAERMVSAGLLAKRMVLTGGASQLLGLDRRWSDRLGTVARIGRPQPIGRMPASMCTPSFATVMGLLAAGAEGGYVQVRSGAGEPVRRERGYLDRMQRWIRESF
ncbi:MAG: cell division protein FtsA [Hyphomicrobiaceae bacterium]